MIGRSIGECIVAGFDNDRIIVVDSFMSMGSPVALRYMKVMNLDPRNVEFVVATHWDNDHVRGLDEIIRRAPKARFISHNVSDRDSLMRLVAEAEEASSGIWSGGVEAFGAAADAVAARGSSPRLVGAGYFLVRDERLAVVALSPTDAAVAAGRAAIARELRSVPRPEGSSAVAVEPNLTSVTLWVETESHTALLGADLERDDEYGWTAAITETAGMRMHGPASLLKVPHHGSPDADAPELWDQLLRKNPHAVVTPFARKRPTDEDVSRIVSRPSRLAIAAGPGWYGRTAGIMQAVIPEAVVDESREACFVRYEAASDGEWAVTTGYC